MVRSVFDDKPFSSMSNIPISRFFDKGHNNVISSERCPKWFCVVKVHLKKFNRFNFPFCFVRAGLKRLPIGSLWCDVQEL